MEQQNIIVVGGLGLIGHEVSRQLHELGHTVAVIDSSTTYGGSISAGEHSFLRNERLGQIWSCTHTDPNRMHIRNCTLTNEFNITEPLSSIDCIIHSAGYPRQKLVSAHPVDAANNMIDDLIRWLEYAVKHKVRRFVYLSSSMVYGDFHQPISESSACRPQGLYAILKHSGEQIVKDYARRTGIEYVIIRPSAVYGPYDVDDRVIAKYFTQAIANKTLQVNGATETLDLTYYTDTARGVVLAATSSPAANQTFNITRGRAIKLLDAAQLVISIVGSGTINVRDKSQDFPSRNALDISAARNLLGYCPKIDIEQGFTLYYDWLRNSFLRRIATIQ